MSRTEIEINIHIFKITDNYKNNWIGVYYSPSEYIKINELNSTLIREYEGPVYGLFEWAINNNFKYSHIQKSISVEI